LSPQDWSRYSLVSVRWNSMIYDRNVQLTSSGNAIQTQMREIRPGQAIGFWDHRNRMTAQQWEMFSASTNTGRYSPFLKKLKTLILDLHPWLPRRQTLPIRYLLHVFDVLSWHKYLPSTLSSKTIWATVSHLITGLMVQSLSCLKRFKYFKTTATNHDCEAFSKLESFRRWVLTSASALQKSNQLWSVGGRAYVSDQSAEIIVNSEKAPDLGPLRCLIDILLEATQSHGKDGWMAIAPILEKQGNVKTFDLRRQG
jgi:hypothetical protein